MSKPKVRKAKPLGYIEIKGGLRPIKVTFDLFLAYMFQDPANYKSLQQILNIFSNEYIKELGICRVSKQSLSKNTRQSKGSGLFRSRAWA